MTTGFRKRIRELVLFSLPLILSGILQQLYGWGDALIVGNIEGELALGAIGGTGAAVGFYQMAIIGFTAGLSVLCGQSYGRRDLDLVRQVLKGYVCFLGAAFLFLAGIGRGFTIPFLQMLSTPADMLEMSGIYMRIVLIGIPFLAVYNVYSAVLRAVGDSRAPFLAILVSTCSNVFLDFLFVAVFRFGISGAAWATVFSQAVMTLFMIGYTGMRHPELRLKGVQIRLGSVLSKGLRFGLPPMIQSLVSSAGNLLLQNFMNGFGTSVVVAITSAYRIDSVALLPVVNLGSAISTFTAQSYGAEDRERTEMVRKAGIVVMVCASILLTGIIIPFGSQLIPVFGIGEESTAIAHDFFIRLASFYLFFGLYSAMRGYLEGIGDVVFASAVGILTLACRVAFSYMFPTLFGNRIIAYAEGASWVIGMLLVFMRMQQKKRSLWK